MSGCHELPSWAQKGASGQPSLPCAQGAAPSTMPSWAQPKAAVGHAEVTVGNSGNPFFSAAAPPISSAQPLPAPGATSVAAPAATKDKFSLWPKGAETRAPAQPKPAQPKADKTPDRCFGIPPCEGFSAAVAIALTLDCIAGYYMSAGHYHAAGAIFSFSAIGWIAAFAFMFGPRKYFRTALLSSWLRVRRTTIEPASPVESSPLVPAHPA